MIDWQPIETAPVSEPDDDIRPRVLMWVADGGPDGSGDIALGVVYRGEYSGTVYARADGYGRDFTVTHWMPLPEPPK